VEVQLREWTGHAKQQGMTEAKGEKHQAPRGVERQHPGLPSNVFPPCPGGGGRQGQKRRCAAADYAPKKRKTTPLNVRQGYIGRKKVKISEIPIAGLRAELHMDQNLRGTGEDYNEGFVESNDKNSQRCLGVSVKGKEREGETGSYWGRECQNSPPVERKKERGGETHSKFHGGGKESKGERERRPIKKTGNGLQHEWREAKWFCTEIYYRCYAQRGRKVEGRKEKEEGLTLLTNHYRRRVRCCTSRGKGNLSNGNQSGQVRGGSR